MANNIAEGAVLVGFNFLLQEKERKSTDCFTRAEEGWNEKSFRPFGPLEGIEKGFG
jgi:hypothetical protein